MLDLRPWQVGDEHHLQDIDLKCYDEPWTGNEWRQATESCIGVLATWDKLPVGMALWRRNVDNFTEVVRLGVKPPYRRRGIGSRLLLNCIADARQMSTELIFTMVPERDMDVIRWLAKRRFKAQAPLLKDHFNICGVLQDGILFSLPVPFN